MQKNNGVPEPGSGLHQACAACKHQRKKCRETCVLAPFFPPSKIQDFQAVQKVFGVRNVQRMLNKLETRDQQQKAVESLVWEARCRTIDPVNGCFGEFKKVSSELMFLRNQQMTMSMLSSSNRIGMDMDMGVNNMNSTINYIHSNGNLYNATPQDALTVARPPHINQYSINSLNQHYYIPEQLKTLDGTNWDGGS
ncbi:hypothetical protein HHK36_003548 [Tetracentron sinense]|uniref:LOB domain-containing protein n=1 Tax=Tetracentron sinense TaxID=13715 RepID=A0A834ZNX4_TETSI|nr:hypothetical protein HHK36_003548 [Tetracentron sinense]